MESSLQMQMNVRNNVQELQSYMLDLNNWEEEMKRKERELQKERLTECLQDFPPPRNKVKKFESDCSQKHKKEVKKISGYDYSAWDKFDVEKACAEIDNEESVKDQKIFRETEVSKEESLEDIDQKNIENEKKLALVDEAFYEKEMGNQFVKKEQWDTAIKCYTNAINLDPNNPIFYANRSLCFLKLKNFKSAEVDATVAIQLDKNYVKAYQRRAFARLALGQLTEAKSDYEQVLRLEPKNALSRVEIEKIEKALKKTSETSKPVSKKNTFNHKDLFKSEEKKTKKVMETPEEKPSCSKELPKDRASGTVNKVCISTQIKEKEELSFSLKKEKETSQKEQSSLMKPKREINIFKHLPEYCKIVEPIELPPHKRSKKPLKKINIVKVYEDEDFQAETKAVRSDSNEKKEEEDVVVKKNLECDNLEKEKLCFDVPKTSIQFQNCWKVIKKNTNKAYLYLKKIPSNKLHQIFENSLESDIFSDLVTFLANDEIGIDLEFIYDFLSGLTHVKRFSTLVLFMSEKDRICIQQCISKLEKVKSKEEISSLVQLYEL